MKDYVIMNVFTGDLVGSVYESIEDAEEWTNNQDVPKQFEIIFAKIVTK